MSNWLKYTARRLVRENAVAGRRAKFLEHDEKADPATHLLLQQHLLRRTLWAASQHIPAYAHLKGRIPSSDLHAFVRQELPVVDKRDLVGQRSRFYPNAGQARPWWSVGMTSGTSGTPLDVFRSLSSTWWEHAFQLQHWRWAGWAGGAQAVLRGDAVVPMTQSAPPYWFHDKVGRELVLSTRHLRRDTAHAMVSQMRNAGVVQLRAYPSAAAQLAQMNDELGLGLRLRSVFTSSEMLYPSQRELIEQSLGAQVFNLYGMAERTVYGMQCPAGRMHVNPSYSFVEIVDSQGRPTDGEGFLVGTTLHNLAMPLLRYRVDDTARWSAEACPCGCTYPVIEALSGRVGDTVYDLDDQPVSAGVITFAFKGVPRIDRAQVAQVGKDLWEVRIVPLPGFNEADAALLMDNFAQKVSSRLQLRLALREQIANLPSGKFKWISQEWHRP